MAVLLGTLLVLSFFIAGIALCTAVVGFLVWLRWRIALVPYFRLSENMRVWYRREQRKDWNTRCGQRVVFGAFFTGVQLPFYIFMSQPLFLRTGTLVIGAVLLARGVWGRWVSGAGYQRQRADPQAQPAHEAFHDIAPSTSARARELLMDIFTAERVIRLGTYTFLVALFVGSLAWDGGARSIPLFDVLH